MRKLYYYAQLGILMIALVAMLAYFNFTAEDAYITYRYAENLITLGALIYNVGEPISALTSPVHALLSAVLFFVTGQTVLSNKLLAVGLLLVSTLLVWSRFRQHPHWQLLALALVLLPPCVLLWTLGGLETPILLFLITLTVFCASRTGPFSLGWLSGILFVAGLAFLTRYDAALFLLPVTLYAITQARSIKHGVIAVIGAAILPLAWFAVSLSYYGDLLPTSYYVKTPRGNFGDLIFNGRYIAAYLVYVGLIPAGVLALALLWSSPQPLQSFYEHLKRRWWLYVGLGFELVYGLTMATHHMMFSFRFFVPYLPAAAFLVVDLIQHASATGTAGFASRRMTQLFAGLLLGLILFQGYQMVYTYTRSVNGISAVGEYRAVGVRDYEGFLHILEREAVDIEQHWETIKGEQPRQPRVITYAAGLLPYTFRDSYIYEKLVSYRHCHQRYQQALYADYIHIIAPRQGTVAQQLPKPEATYSLVSSYEMFFDGSSQTFLVYYNPAPEAHNLSATIDGSCPPGESDLSLRFP